jgi:NADH-quinone oxidoreductase subunit L
MLLLQEAAYAAQSAAHGGAFEPILPGLIILLPFLGFMANGLLSVIAARRALPALPPVGDPSYDHDDAHVSHSPAHAPAYAHAGAAPSEQEGRDAGTRPNPVDGAHDHDAHHGSHDAHGHGAHDDDHGHDDHHAPAGPKPFTHTLPSLIAPGVMLLAFLLARVPALLRVPEPLRVRSCWCWCWARATR